MLLYILYISIPVCIRKSKKNHSICQTKTPEVVLQKCISLHVFVILRCSKYNLHKFNKAVIKRNIFTVYRKLCITENICVSLFKTLKACSLPLNCIYFVFSKCSLPFKMLGKLAMSIAFITRVNNIQFKLQSTIHVSSSNIQQCNPVCILYC